MDDHEHVFEGAIQFGRIYCDHPWCRASKPITDAEAVYLMFGGVMPEPEPPRPALRIVESANASVPDEHDEPDDEPDDEWGEHDDEPGDGRGYDRPLDDDYRRRPLAPRQADP